MASIRSSMSSVFDRVSQVASVTAVLSSLVSMISLLYTAYVIHESSSINVLIAKNLEEERAIIASSRSGAEVEALLKNERMIREKLDLPDRVLCIGNPSRGCPNKTDAQFRCNSDPHVEAQKTCGNADFTLKLLSSSPGGQCGYTELAVACNSRNQNSGQSPNNGSFN